MGDIINFILNTLKHPISIFILGIVIGFLFSIFVYYFGLGQFTNEIHALYNLYSKRYKHLQEIEIKGGIGYTLNEERCLLLPPGSKAYLIRDVGVEWFPESKGLMRVRVLWVKQNLAELDEVFKISHRSVK